MAFAPRPDHIACAPRQIVAPSRHLPALATRPGSVATKPAIVYALDFKVDKLKPVAQLARGFPSSVTGVLPAPLAKAVLKGCHPERMKTKNYQHAVIARNPCGFGKPAVRIGAVFQKVMNQRNVDAFIR